VSFSSQSTRNLSGDRSTNGWHANSKHSFASALVFEILNSCTEQIVERDHAHKPSIQGIQNRKTGQADWPFATRRHREARTLLVIDESDADGKLEVSVKIGLFLSQSYHWVHAAGSPRRDDRGGECDDCQQCRYGQERSDVCGAYAEQQAGDHAS
jgi:hypothetical protein